MPIVKRILKNGKKSWGYKFDAPGSTRSNRLEISKFGFKTEREAIHAEAERRIEAQKQGELAAAAPLPKTLGEVIDEFIREHAEKKLSPTTVERYRLMVPYLAAELRSMPIGDITALHLHREWNRLLESGGRVRKTKAAKPMAPKTVRNIAGLVSAAFGKAILWGLTKYNPVTDSDLPSDDQKRPQMAYTVAQQRLLIDSAHSEWGLNVFLEVDAACGARRGEVLALQWSDLNWDTREVTIEKTLIQTKFVGVVQKDCTKTKEVRVVTLPKSAIEALKAHRRRQQEFRDQFGPTYRLDLNLIFCNPDGTPLRPNSVSSAVSALCKKLKLPRGASLHTLRHSHGSHLLAEGVPLPVVSERLGHSSTHTTAKIYSHAIKGQDREAADIWEKYQQKGTAPAIADDKHTGGVN